MSKEADMGNPITASEAYRKESAESLNKGQWILATDRLPPEETPVLVLRCDQVRVGAIFWDYPSYEDTYKAYRYWDDPYDDGQMWEFDEVTHWMPLPDTPPTSAHSVGREQPTLLLSLSSA